MASVSHSMATTTSVLSVLSEDTAMLSNIMLANDDDLAIALGTSQIRGCRLVAYILLTTIRVIAQEKSKDPIKWRVLSNNDGKLENAEVVMHSFYDNFGFYIDIHDMLPKRSRTIP